MITCNWCKKPIHVLTVPGSMHGDCYTDATRRLGEQAKADRAFMGEPEHDETCDLDGDCTCQPSSSSS